MEWILEPDRGAGIPWKGNYRLGWIKTSTFENKKKRPNLHVKKPYENWNGRVKIPKRVKPKQGRLARFNGMSEHEYQNAMRQEIFIPVAERLGNEVIEFKNVSKTFGDRLLIDNQLQDPPGAIVGIIGPKRCG